MSAESDAWDEARSTFTVSTAEANSRRERIDFLLRISSRPLTAYEIGTILDCLDSIAAATLSDLEDDGVVRSFFATIDDDDGGVRLYFSTRRIIQPIIPLDHL